MLGLHVEGPLTASPCAYGGSEFVFRVVNFSELGLRHDAFVGLVCGLDTVSEVAAAL
jgi:hypothetical protein